MNRKEIIYIVVGALIPAYPFYLFISHYLSLAPFDCGHFGWFSDCGVYATIWLVAEAIGVSIIIKGLLLYFKKHPKSKLDLRKRSTRSNPLM